MMATVTGLANPALCAIGLPAGTGGGAGAQGLCIQGGGFGGSP